MRLTAQSASHFSATWIRPARESRPQRAGPVVGDLALGLTAEKGDGMEWMGRTVWGVNVAPAVVERALGAMDFTRRALCRKGLLAALPGAGQGSRPA